MRTAALVTALVLALPAAAAAAKPRLVLVAPTHTPKAGAAWPYAVVVTDEHGRLVPARVHLQIVLGPLPVGQVGRHSADGFWAETLEWPSDAVGQTLVLQVDATAGGSTARVRYPVTTAATGTAAGDVALVRPGLAVRVVNRQAPRAASLVATGRALDVRWRVTCNRPKGSQVDSLAGRASGSGTLRRALAIPPGRHADCAVGAVAAGRGRVAVRLAAR